METLRRGCDERFSIQFLRQFMLVDDANFEMVIGRRLQVFVVFAENSHC